MPGMTNSWHPPLVRMVCIEVHRVCDMEDPVAMLGERVSYIIV